MFHLLQRVQNAKILQSNVEVGNVTKHRVQVHFDETDAPQFQYQLSSGQFYMNKNISLGIQAYQEKEYVLKLVDQLAASSEDEYEWVGPCDFVVELRPHECVQENYLARVRVLVPDYEVERYEVEKINYRHYYQVRVIIVGSENNSFIDVTLQDGEKFEDKDLGVSVRVISGSDGYDSHDEMFVVDRNFSSAFRVFDFQDSMFLNGFPTDPDIWVEKLQNNQGVVPLYQYTTVKVSSSQENTQDQLYYMKQDKFFKRQEQIIETNSNSIKILAKSFSKDVAEFIFDAKSVQVVEEQVGLDYQIVVKNDMQMIYADLSITNLNNQPVIMNSFNLECSVGLDKQQFMVYSDVVDKKLNYRFSFATYHQQFRDQQMVCLMRNKVIPTESQQLSFLHNTSYTGKSNCIHLLNNECFSGCENDTEFIDSIGCKPKLCGESRPIFNQNNNKCISISDSSDQYIENLSLEIIIPDNSHYLEFICGDFGQQIEDGCKCNSGYHDYEQFGYVIYYCKKSKESVRSEPYKISKEEALKILRDQVKNIALKPIANWFQNIGMTLFMILGLILIGAIVLPLIIQLIQCFCKKGKQIVKIQLPGQNSMKNNRNDLIV